MLPGSVPSKGQSIHVNPKFKNNVLQKLNHSSCSNPALMTLPSTTHINPLFIKPLKKAAIHMNPQFLSDKFSEQWEPKILRETTEIQRQIQTGFPINSEPETLQLNKIISKSRTRIIRETNSQPKAAVLSPPKQLFALSKRKLIRAPISLPILSSRSNSAKKDVFFVRKSVNKQMRVIIINGILYKSTGNKLQRNVEGTAPTKSLQVAHTTNKKSESLKTSKSSVGRALYVRGAKYVMDPTGFKLTRVTQPKVSTNSTQVPEPKTTTSSPHNTLPRRINIGGITYLSSSHSENVFLRTSSHLNLAHLNQTKQRSVQLLSRSLIKTNKPCLIFQRLGKCAALERNRCSKVHDKERIVVCPKFLLGQCCNENCLLSHTKTLQKMPVCKFFLQGSCVRSCPYLHKKLSDDSEICEDFRSGFCALGEQCNKQHVFSKSKSTLNITPESVNEISFLSIKGFSTSSEAISYRYFNGETYALDVTEKETGDLEDGDCKRDKIERDEKENNKENLRKNWDRKQLGTLPAFIPLS